MSAGGGQNKLLVLDGIRGLAAVFVVIFHARNHWGGLPVPHAYLAVDLFFVMSGFVIGRAYDQRLTTGQFTFRDFMVARLVRLYPLFVISAICCLVLFLAGHLVDPSRFPNGPGPVMVAGLLALLFLPAPLGHWGTLYPLNPPFWSLFFELLVNCLYGRLHPFLTRRVLAACIAAAVVVVVCGGVWKDSINIGSGWNAGVVVGFSRAILGIFGGILLHRTGAAWMPVVTPLRIHHLIPIGAVMVMLGMQDLPGRLGNAGFDLLAVLVVFPVVIMTASVAPVGPWWSRVYGFAGAVSYAVYVIHQPILALMNHSLDRIDACVPVLSGVLLVAMAMFIGHLLDTFYDIPVRAWLGRRFTRKRPKEALTAPVPGAPRDAVS